MYDNRGGDPEGCSAVLLLVFAFAVGSLMFYGLIAVFDCLVTLFA